jgi:hypothetical protein
MSKHKKEIARAKRLKWLDKNPNQRMKEAVKRAAADYILDEKLDHHAYDMKKIKLKDLHCLLKERLDCWEDVEVEDINTSKHKAIKILNDTLGNLLNNKKSLDKIVTLAKTENESSLSENSSDEEPSDTH